MGLLNYFKSCCESQSSPSYNPVPSVAHVDWMYHCKYRVEKKTSFLTLRLPSLVSYTCRCSETQEAEIILLVLNL